MATQLSNFWNKDEVGSAQQDQNTSDIAGILAGTLDLSLLTVLGNSTLAKDSGVVILGTRTSTGEKLQVVGTSVFTDLITGTTLTTTGNTTLARDGGNVLVGTATDSGTGFPLQVVENTNASNVIEISNSSTGVLARTGFVAAQSQGSSASAGFFVTGANYTGIAGWGDACLISSNSALSGGVIFNSSSSTEGFRFALGGSFAFDMTRSGNLIIGKTTDSGTGYKLQISGGSLSQGSRIKMQNDDTSAGGCDFIMNPASGSLKFNMLLRENADMGFWTNNTERMTITNGGNVLIGNTSNYDDELLILHGGVNKIRLNNNASKTAVTQSVNSIIFAQHFGVNEVATIDSYETGTATDYAKGGLLFKTNNLSGLTERVRITPNGDFLIGTTTDSGPRLVVSDGVNVGGLPSIGPEIVGLFQNDLDSSDKSALVILGGTAGESNIYFGDTLSAAVGRIVYDHSSNFQSFYTNFTEGMRLTSSNHLLINTTSDLATLTVGYTGTDDIFNFGGAVSGANLKLSYFGNELLFGRPDLSYLWADSTGGFIAIGTNGRGRSSVNSNVIFNADQTTTFNNDVLCGSGLGFSESSADIYHTLTTTNISLHGGPANTGGGVMVFGASASSSAGEVHLRNNSTPNFKLLSDGNVWVALDVSALSFTDRTPYPETLELAYDAIMSMKRLPDGEYDVDNKEHQLDHSSLHPYLEGAGTEPSRDMSATISCLVEIVKDLKSEIDLLKSRL